ncbi:MAG TPA: phosphotransferase [Tepidisphaeraceae bacterium]|jgi:aminoglycoside phosphotransferase (APT) family kinase protein
MTTLDIENFPALLQYLRAASRIAPYEAPILTNLAGGVSNRTVLLERSNGESWVLKQALARLRVAADWRSDPRRIEREALGMQTLTSIAPPGSITPLIFLDPAHHLLAMQAVPQPHDNWKSMLLAGKLDLDHIRQFARLLAAIHSAGFQRREEFAGPFEDRSYFESLRLEPYYQYAAERMPAVEPFISQLIANTRATRYTLVHGDYSPKNVLIQNNRLILLDHEVIHFGDGTFDLGFALTHLLSKANALVAHRDRFAQAARLLWETYRAAVIAPSEIDLETRAVHHTLACLLARCIGRSPLEYLTPPPAARQANAASAMMDNPPAGIDDLINNFLKKVS